MSVTEDREAGADAPYYPMARTCPFDPPPEIERIRDDEPVHRVRVWDGSTPWVITRHEDVRAVLADPRFSAEVDRPGYPPTSPGVKARRESAPTFITLDDPEHGRLRKMIISEFSVRRIEALRPMVAELVDGLLDAMDAGGPPADLVASFALPVPSLVICRMLGVPYTDHDFFQDRSRVLIDTRSTPEDAVAANEDLRRYLAGLVAARESEPTDDLLGRLAARRVVEGELSRDDAASMALLLLVAGHETTANMISLGTMRLLAEPAEAARVRDGDPAEVAGAVEELLRLLTVVHLGRRRAATEDVEVGGVTVRAGEGVIVAGEAANRDPDAFPHPDELDLDRASNHHVAFGYGVHQCLGQQLARMELQVAYPALLRRFPDLHVTVPADEIRYRDEMAVYGVHELPVAW